VGVIVEPAKPDDRQQILAVTSRIENFTEDEKDTVRELWDEQTLKGQDVSGYNFVVARHEGEVVGFACYGPRALTEGTYDLFWIAVDPSARRLGVGVALMRAAESEVRKRSGRLLIVETSGQEKYSPTRKFYEGVGYQKEAVIRDFYDAGDDLVIYTMHF
jgi:ribosomal protein S18 acetylase RimI-like enzyme